MCTISVEVNEKMLRSNGGATDMKFSHDMTPEELYDVIAEEIDHIYVSSQF